MQEFELEWKLNILDIVSIVVAFLSLVATLVIAFYVQRWSRRSAENMLLWEVASRHWRSAIALYDNLDVRGDGNSGKVGNVAREIDVRRQMIGRTVEQIRALDGAESKLASAFEAVADIEDWNHREQPERNRIAFYTLTDEMAKKFGSRRASKNVRAVKTTKIMSGVEEGSPSTWQV